MSSSLLSGVTNSISLDKDLICDGLEETYEDLIDDLSDSVSSGRDKWAAVRAMFDDFFENYGMSNLSGKLNALSQLNDLINDSLTFNSGTADDLLACLGTSVKDLLGFDLDKLLADADIDFSKYASSIADQLKKFVDNAIDSILDGTEKSILDALGEMEDLINTDTLDYLLALVGCLVGHCDPSDVSSEYDIEEMLEESGYSISGEVDLGQSDLTKTQQKYFNSLKSAVNTVDDSVTNKITNIF